MLVTVVNLQFTVSQKNILIIAGINPSDSAYAEPPPLAQGRLSRFGDLICKTTKAVKK